MSKHLYKDVKHPDKFHELLSHAWARMEPYALQAGIAVLALVAVATVWFVVARQRAASLEKPWAQAFDIQRRASDALATARTDADRETIEEQVLADLAALAREQARRPVAALALIELSQAQFRRGHLRRTQDPDAARDRFRAAAEAAEQFLADFPNHGLRALAAYNAGKARLELREYPRAVQHFQQAHDAPIRSLAALARWHTARCQERLGQLDAARQAYEALRNDPWAGWCAQQAQWRLSQLQSRPTQGS
ncbi:MAG: tetratricopeptide repeat protein [Candidatus Brocadiae bacterium]|nr:tetratricopeptide repeat protein [Candidatus Brocadiia bacterium]